MKKDIAMVQAFGSGDWRKVIELESAALAEVENKQFSYAMIGAAYENLSDHENAKESYAKSLEIDERCAQALEGLSRIYFNQKDYEIAYHYAKRGLYSVEEVDFSMPGFLKTALAIVVKIFRPSRPFAEIQRETQAMDQSRERWKSWALEFVEWYEKTDGQQETPKLH